MEEDDAICGAVLVYETPDMFCGRSLYIEFLAVLPDYQNKGVDRALIEYVCDEAHRGGSQKFLSVLPVIKMHI